MRQALIKLLIAAAIIYASALPALAQNKQQADDQLTALFLFNFVNFAEWPKEAFASADAPIQMCLYGSIPFSSYLNAVDGTLIGSRKLNIKQTQKLDDIRSGCHMLFVSQDRHAELPEFWLDINYYYVLSVGEQEAFTDRGGIINIMRTTDQLTFDINVGNALEAGLFLEADLLHLARKIKQ
ncbi:YfiR family protein [Agaribacterium haliotis]|uniref:YfiR family protein n=1 Tax=Agaribacterium haliotis TaxID=2013869 RepID=UPI000BB5758D|nr:YfiR family protein [Agaribacterium haliotis]